MDFLELRGTIAFTPPKSSILAFSGVTEKFLNDSISPSDVTYEDINQITTKLINYYC